MPNNGFGQVIKHGIYADISSYTDEQLARVARQREPCALDAVEALLRRYDRDIYRACLSYLRNPSMAEEASQEVLIRLYHGVSRFQERSSFRTWLYRIVRNECYSVSRKHARHKVCDPLEEVELQHDSAMTRDFAETVQRRNAVNVALHALSSNDREVLRLRYFDDLSLNAIAGRLDTSLSGAKMRLYRALARFEFIHTKLEADNGYSLPA